MAELHLTEADLDQLKEKGISKQLLETQLRRFDKGYPYLDIVQSADENGGVIVMSQEEIEDALKVWEDTLHSSETEVVKFVPASGAASRMFKELYAFLNGGEKSEGVQEVLDHIKEFAFFDALNRACMLGEGGKGCEKLIQLGEERTVIEYLLGAKGLNYGKLPKALLLFHRYPDGSRTAAEEQLVEGAKYARNSDGKVKIHFTLSPEHIEPFEALMQRRVPELEDKFSVQYEISHSIQKSETDTIAVDMNNEPMRNEDGSLMFRPGGHGALIWNLNEVDADIIFIKNIDNVVPQLLSCDTIIYKKVIGGYLIKLQGMIFKYMAQLSGDKRANAALLSEIKEFMQRVLCIDTAGMEGLPLEEQSLTLRRLLNRPIRVCGMVRNEGEPGGGPYVVRDEDGITGLQILESSQINKGDEKILEIFRNGRFFNPVDLVCGVKDYRGQKFDLLSFVDEETGFISQKSQAGVDLKALELPGLWNGAMSQWNTAFVAVPASTFNPVKTVNDLLRPAHTAK